MPIARQAIKVSQLAFKAVTSAINGRDRGSMSIELGVHNKALEARFAAEKFYQVEMQRRKTLVPIAELTESFRRSMDSVLQRLKKLPQETGPRCNAADPLMAMTVLQQEVDSIIAEARESLDST